MIRFGIRNLSLTAAAVLLMMPQNTAIFAQSNPCTGVSDSGIAYSNPALFEQSKIEWLACIASRPRDVLVLEQAADLVGDPRSRASARSVREGASDRTRQFETGIEVSAPVQPECGTKLRSNS
jgi:hypothetical protein